MFEGLLQPTHFSTALLLFLPFAIFAVIPCWLIMRKTGHPGWLSLLLAIPFVGIFLLYWLAFSKWPLEKAVKQTNFPL